MRTAKFCRMGLSHREACSNQPACDDDMSESEARARVRLEKLSSVCCALTYGLIIRAGKAGEEAAPKEHSCAANIMRCPPHLSPGGSEGRRYTHA